MSESRNDFGRKSITPKTIKRHPRVDLTAMVSVSFLLIIFFMLTSYLSKPQALNLGMPENNTGCGGVISCGDFEDNRHLTLLLGENNKIVSYIGHFDLPLEAPKNLTYEKNSIRKELLEKNNLIQKQSGNSRIGLIVIIKPSKKSTYKNLVDVLDEMAIVKVPTYAVVDITPEELKLLSLK